MSGGRLRAEGVKGRGGGGIRRRRMALEKRHGSDGGMSMGGLGAGTRGRGKHDMTPAAIFLVVAFSAIPVASCVSGGDFILGFGKHKGAALRDIPLSYVEWMVREKVYGGRAELEAALLDMKLLPRDPTVDQRHGPSQPTPRDGTKPLHAQAGGMRPGHGVGQVVSHGAENAGGITSGVEAGQGAGGGGSGGVKGGGVLHAAPLLDRGGGVLHAAPLLDRSGDVERDDDAMVVDTGGHGCVGAGPASTTTEVDTGGHGCVGAESAGRVEGISGAPAPTTTAKVMVQPDMTTAPKSVDGYSVKAPGTLDGYVLGTSPPGTLDGYVLGTSPLPAVPSGEAASAGKKKSKKAKPSKANIEVVWGASGLSPTREGEGGGGGGGRDADMPFLALRLPPEGLWSGGGDEERARRSVQTLGGKWNATGRFTAFELADMPRIVAELAACGFTAPTGMNAAPTSLVKALSRLSSSPGGGGGRPAADAGEGIPTELIDRLMPFQREGVEFVLGMGGRAMIGDEMGLGKTVQAIAAASAYRTEWPLLIVCPASLRLNWLSEVTRWLPDLSVHDVEVIFSAKQAPSARDPLKQVTILSYDLMPRIVAALKGRIGVAICDESHYLKSPTAQRTKACSPLLKGVKRLVLLSGTPALARPCELYSQVSCLRPKMFPSRREFEKRYCDPRRGRWGMDVTGAANLSELYGVLQRHFMIRRRKGDVLTELPSKVRQQVFIATTSMPSKKGKAPMPTAADVEGMMASGEGGWAEGGGGDGRSELADMYRETGLAKTPAACQYIQDLVEGGGKFLVFAHHISVLDALEAAAKGTRRGVIRIDGSVKASERQALVDKFQTDSDVRVAVLGLTAAGTGLTLTAASTVVFAELSWTPGIMSQAEDRVHRIGQRECVNIHYLIGRETLDDAMWPGIVRKLKVTSSFLDGNNDEISAWKHQGPRASRQDDVVMLGPASEGGTGTQTDISGYMASSKAGTRADGSSAEVG